ALISCTHHPFSSCAATPPPHLSPLSLHDALPISARLAAGPTAAFREIKRVLAAASTSTLAEALENEQAAQTRLGATHDHREAVDAFVNKRAPRFTGK